MANEWVILHAGALGDLVLTIQLALRLLDPRRAPTPSTLHVVSRTDPGDLSGCTPAIRRTSSEVVGLHWAYANDTRDAPPALRYAISGRRVLAALGEPDTPAVQRLRTLAPTTLYTFEPAPQPGSFRHITEQWSTQLEAQGLLIPKCVRQRWSASLRPDPELQRRGRRLLARAIGDEPAEQRICLLHPGSGGMRKCWPIDAYIELACALVGICTPLLLFGPAEIERGVFESARKRAPDIPVIACTEASELASLLTAADAFVGNDAGPAHLAGLLGANAIALFGPSAAEVWRPLGQCVTVISGRPREDGERWGITNEAVLANVAKLLAQPRCLVTSAFPDDGGRQCE